MSTPRISDCISNNNTFNREYLDNHFSKVRFIDFDCESYSVWSSVDRLLQEPFWVPWRDYDMREDHKPDYSNY